MKNILVPTDFSNNAQKATEFAARFATRCGAVIHVVHALYLFENKLGDINGLRDAWNEEQRTEKTAQLLQQKQWLHENFPGLKVHTHLFKGSTDNVLMQYCKSNDIDLIIMGTRGASGLGEILVGSVTASVIGISTVPVLAIPEGYQGDMPSFMVLAESTFDYPVEKLKIIFDFAALLDIPVKVLEFADEDESDIFLEQEARLLETHTHTLKALFPLISIHSFLLEGDDFEASMQQYCNQPDAVGVLCMLTTRRNFWDKFFNPSMTKKMAYHTKVPLLAVPV